MIYERDAVSYHLPLSTTQPYTPEVGEFRPNVRSCDQVRALIINQQQQGLICERYDPLTQRLTWEVLGCPLYTNRDPLAAITQQLAFTRGYHCSTWQHLSTFEHALPASGVTHFFLGQDALMMHSLPMLEMGSWRWVTLAELRNAVWDGRLACLQTGAMVALALLALQTA